MNLQWRLIFRNLWKSRFTTAINIIGLSIGMASCLLILMFTSYESSFDQFNENYDRIYRIRFTESKNNEPSFDAVLTAPPVGPAIVENFPEVENQVRIMVQLESVISVQNEHFEELNISYVDNSFFEVFTCNFVEGNWKDPLKGPKKAVISASAAKKYFDGKSALNQTILLDDQEEFIITAVIEDLPANSHFRADVLLSYDSPHWLNVHYDQPWDMNFLRTYLLLKPGADPNELTRKINDLAARHKPEKYIEFDWDYQLQPLKDIHLYSKFEGEFGRTGNGRINSILTVAAFLILVIAWINYINLATAKAVKRAKAVGIQKIFGISRFSLVGNFMAEAMLLNIAGMLIALLVILGVKNYIAEIFNTSLVFPFWDRTFLFQLLSVFFLGAFLSAFYPSLVTASFNPLQTLKGYTVPKRQNTWLKKSLIVFQFIISAVLICSTLVIYQQTNYMLYKDLGIDINHTLVVKGMNLNLRDSLERSKVEVFRHRIRQHDEILQFTACSALPANEAFTTGIYSDLQTLEQMETHSIYFTDHGFIPAFKLKLLAGRGFTDSQSERNSVVINQTSARALGFENPADALGHRVYRDFGNPGEKYVVGVVQDFHLGKLQDVIKPVIIFYSDSQKRFFSIKYRPGTRAQVAGVVQKTWEEAFGDEIFRYFDLTQSYQDQYLNERTTSILLTIFAILAIFIGCIGLFGLAYFTIIQRTREIGIRKVVGASVIRIINLINQDFLKLVFTASLIGTPIAWFMSYKWLQNYSYRIEVDWWLFLLPFLILAFITMLTVSYYTVKAAIANPIRSLRQE